MTEQEANKIRKDILKASNNGVLDSVSHCEYFTITHKLRYKKKEIDLGDGTAKTEYRLQQMWQGSGGTEDWQWVEYVD